MHLSAFALAAPWRFVRRAVTYQQQMLDYAPRAGMVKQRCGIVTDCAGRLRTIYSFYSTQRVECRHALLVRDPQGAETVGAVRFSREIH